MEIEQKIVSFPIDENLQAEIEKVTAEGWKPYVTPVATYYLVREKNKPAAATPAMGRMVIDDSKVFVLDKDGNIKH